MVRQINVDIKPRGLVSAYVEAPFDEGKEALESQGYKIISLAENARLRIQEGKDSFVSRNGNWVKEDIIYVPRKGKFLTRVSHILANTKEATACHRNGNEFYLTDEQVEEALSDCVELSRDVIPTDRFRDNVVTAYAFGEDAEKYGIFLNEVGIKELPVVTVNMQEKPFTRKLWFRCLGDGSELGGDDWALYCGDRVRGVQNCAEGTAKNLEAYTPSQLSEALRNIGLTGIEKGLLARLRQ
jgi:hypothetical protein